ncbi:MAG: helicase C-terminal domain-containing protein [Candidatus Heimdallarchaeota archaeon]
MTIKINRDKKELSLSVRDLTLYGVSSKSRIGIFFKNAEAGQEIHSQIQEKKQRENAAYQQEFFVKHSFFINGWQITIRGRIDLILKTPQETKIEEIKTIYTKRFEDSQKDPQIYSYKLQLLFYAWILSKIDPDLSKPVLRLIIVNRYDNQQYDVDVPYEDVTKDIHKRILDVIAKEQENYDQYERKVNSLKYLQFPFPYRQYQEDIIHRIEGVIKEGLNLIIEAPSGLGKTVVSLYTLLPKVINENTKLFFLTAKTTQRHIVVQTLKIFRKQGVDFLGIVLRAKEKMCTNEFYFCHEDFCPFLKAHVYNNPEIYKEKIVKQRGIITPEIIEDLARETQGFCPFELALDVSLDADVIIGDYNYVFHPRVVLQRFFGEGVPRTMKYFLIIDEAHNLVARSTTYYSHSLLQREIVTFKRACRQLKRKFKGIPLPTAVIPELEKIFRDLQVLISSRPTNITTHVMETSDLPLRTLKAIIVQYEDEITHYIRFLVENGYHWPEDPVLQFYYHLRTLVETAINVPLYPKEFSILFNSNEGEIKILCKDASLFLAQQFQKFNSVIAISATISPFHFYRDLLGLPVERTIHERYPSPFPSERRKILVITDVDTRYTNRHLSYHSIADFLKRATLIKPGRYFVFFPSFEYAKKVLNHYSTEKEQLILRQNSFMTEEERIRFIHTLGKAPQVLAVGVTSGIFAEGIDLPGILDGIFIVGPSLPPVSVERELIRSYYDDKYNDGFTYAYQFPGLTRTFQAAGRLIRSASDYGIIVFIGYRFGTSGYSAHFPSYYYRNHPRELVSTDPISEIEAFWQLWEKNKDQLSK